MIVTTGRSARARSARATLAAMVLISCAVGIRTWASRSVALHPDEAESSINALSILEHGVPMNTYLGQPVFENMLVRPWPESEEYEFRDISYSDRGLAVYHSWLPLYAIASSFRVFGIDPPDAAEPDWTITVDEGDFAARTFAARLPSLVFSTVFLLAVFQGARLLGGIDTAFAALVVAGFSRSLVETTLMARYHSLTLALAALAAMTLWRLIERGTWSRYLVHAGVLVAMFHTQLIAFAVLSALTVLSLLWTDRQPARLFRCAISLGLVGLAALPWLVLSGFLSNLRYVPSSFMLRQFPDDLIVYLSERQPYLLVYMLGFGWLALVWALHGRALPQRFQQPWRPHQRQYLLLLVWMALSIAAWYGLSPPASQFPTRLSLYLFVPGTLALALVLADTSRMFMPSRAVVVAPLLAVGFLIGSQLLQLPATAGRPFVAISATFEHLNSMQLGPGARVYGSPASHLVLAFYSRKPIQSLAPIRKQFLDSYSGEVVFIESMLPHEFASPDTETIEREAARLGHVLPPGESAHWALMLRTQAAAEAVRHRVGEVVPPPAPLPAFARAALDNAIERVERETEFLEDFRDLPFYRGYSIRTGRDIWEVFFYRLVEPDTRRGQRLNAADRLRGGRAYVIPEALRVVFYSPPQVATHHTRDPLDESN